LVPLWGGLGRKGERRVEGEVPAEQRHVVHRLDDLPSVVGRVAFDGRYQDNESHVKSMNNASEIAAA
jgi:hypothetical protein